MSRKDYRLIAMAIEASMRGAPGPKEKRGIELTANSLATYLEDDNPLFNRDKFYKACKVYKYREDSK